MKLKSLILFLSMDQLTQTVAALFYYIRVLKLLYPNSVVISGGFWCTYLLRLLNLLAVGKALLPCYYYYSTWEKKADWDQGGNYISAQLAGAPKTWFTLTMLYTVSLCYSSHSTRAERTVNTWSGIQSVQTKLIPAEFLEQIWSSQVSCTTSVPSITQLRHFNCPLLGA